MEVNKMPKRTEIVMDEYIGVFGKKKSELHKHSIR